MSNNSRAALITQVKEQYLTKGKFIQKIKEVEEKAILKVAGQLDSDINEVYKEKLNYDAIKSETYAKRLKTLITKIETSLEKCILNRTAYQCSYTELTRYVEQVCAAYSDKLYSPDFSSFKKGEISSLVIYKSQRAYKQMQHCTELEQSMIEERIIEMLYYQDMRTQKLLNYKADLVESAEIAGHSNYEEEKLQLKIESKDSPIQRYFKTLRRKIEIEHNINQFWNNGLYIYLTNQDNDCENQISWKDEK